MLGCSRSALAKDAVSPEATEEPAGGVGCCAGVHGAVAPGTVAFRVSCGAAQDGGTTRRCWEAKEGRETELRWWRVAEGGVGEGRRRSGMEAAAAAAAHLGGRRWGERERRWRGRGGVCEDRRGGEWAVVGPPTECFRVIMRLWRPAREAACTLDSQSESLGRMVEKRRDDMDRLGAHPLAQDFSWRI